MHASLHRRFKLACTAAEKVMVAEVPAFISSAVSSFAALQAFEKSDRFWRPHLLCHLVPGPRLCGICRKTSDAKRIKNIRIICRPEVHGCPRIPAFDQSTQGGPGGFDVTGGEFHRSNSFD